MNTNNRRLLLLGGLALIVAVAYFAGAFKSSEPPAPAVRPSIRAANRNVQPAAPAGPAKEYYPEDPSTVDAQPVNPATQPAEVSPATQPLAAGPATQPLAAAPATQPSTLPADVALAPTTAPSTAPAVAGGVEGAAPATNPAIAAAPAAPTTNPAIAEAPATQPSTAPAVAAAPATQPSTGPAVAVAEIKVPEVDPNDPRPYKLRLLLAQRAAQPPSTEPTLASMAATQPTRVSSSTSTSSNNRVSSSSSSRDRDNTRGSSSSSSRDRVTSGSTAVAAPKPFRMERPTPIPEEFTPILERSLFSKERPVSRNDRTDFGNPGGGTPTFPPQPAFRPESRLALRGLVVEDQESFAFLENLDTGAPEVHRLGEKVAQGKIVNIGFTNLVYETADGKQTTVTIGNTFDGMPAPTATSLLSSGMTSSSSGSSPQPPSYGSQSYGSGSQSYGSGSSSYNRPPYGSGSSGSSGSYGSGSYGRPPYGSGSTGAPSALGGTSPAASPPSGAPSAGSQSLIELMKKRRQEQGGR